LINESPRSGPGPDPDLGVRRREIVWRASRLRPLPRGPVRLPRWVDRLVLVLLVAYLLGGLAAAPYVLEEAVQDSLARDAGTLFTRPAALLPGSEATSPTQESVRLAYGSLTRFAVAPGWYAGGGHDAKAPVDLTVPGPGPVLIPETGLLVSARLGPALVSAIGVLVVFALTRRLAGRTAALAAAVLFALHPTIALVGRQSLDAGLTLTLGLGAVLLAAGISTTVSRGRDPGLSAWTGLAVLAGLTLASGPTAPPYLAGAAAFCGAGLIARQVRRHRREPGPAPVAGAARVGPRTGIRGSGPEAPRSGPLAWLAASALGALLVWVALSPALWGWLPERLAARAADRPVLIAQGLLPDPGAAGPGSRLRALAGLLTDPFLTPPAPTPGVRPADLRGYEGSWWSGLPLGGHGPLPGAGVVGTVLALVLTAAALAGAVALWRSSRARAFAVAGWALGTALWVLARPATQLEHDVPVTALACVLAALAVPPLLARRPSRTGTA
jgi:hypothetical protein